MRFGTCADCKMATLYAGSTPNQPFYQAILPDAFMRRGELYRVAHPLARDPKKCRVFVIVSRQVLIDSRFSSVICAPIYTAYDGLATQVPIGPDEGLKDESSIHCNELIRWRGSIRPPLPARHSKTLKKSVLGMPISRPLRWVNA